MDQLDAPWGVCIVHQYYPGFIDLPENSQYFVDSPEIRGAVHLLEHKRPLIVSDFDNEMFERKSGEKTRIELRREINRVDENSVHLQARGHEGRVGPVISVEHNIDGRIFRHGMFTSLQFLSEVYDQNTAQQIGLQGYRKLLERFIGTYRFLERDTRLSFTSQKIDMETPLRIGYFRYTSADKKLPWERRIAKALPGELRLSTLSYQDGAGALQDHADDEKITISRAERIGGFLSSGFNLPESLVELERLVDLAFRDKKFRLAIVEVMSLLELGILDAKIRFSKIVDFAEPKNPSKITWHHLINSILPGILGVFSGDVESLMNRAKEALELRHKVVHRGHSLTEEEANFVLSFVYTFLCIVELQEKYRSGWKRKST